jgi:5-methylcytosine-specific restriction endonuclease McrA
MTPKDYARRYGARLAAEKRLRTRLAKAQGGRCCYCRRAFEPTGPLQVTLEHKKARMDGGRTIPSNLAAACLHCNQHRGRQMNNARQLARAANPAERPGPSAGVRDAGGTARLSSDQTAP